MSRAEHPGKSAAARRSWLYILILYGAAFLCGRAAGWLPTLPYPLPERTARPGSTELFLPFYLIETALRHQLAPAPAAPQQP